MMKMLSGLLILLLLSACGGRPRAETAVDPKPTEATESVPGPTLATPAAVPIIPAILLVDGYRVQLFQSSLLRDAEQFRDAAAVRLDRPVYVEFQTPAYRVLAGDFKTHEDAESWRGGLAARGFERTEVVATLVRGAG